MDSRGARVARGWAAAAFATFVAAFSHVAAGGSSPTPFAIVVSLVISTMLATLLAGRTVSLARLTVSIGLSQVLFHSLFSSLGAPSVVAHSHSLPALDVVSHEHSSMWVAHTIAGLVTIVAFRHAESALWGLLQTARLFLTRLVGFVITRAPLPIHTPVRSTPCALRPLTIDRSSLKYRGPPVGCLV